jgi:hypothetical protein
MGGFTVHGNKNKRFDVIQVEMLEVTTNKE